MVAHGPEELGRLGEAGDLLLLEKAWELCPLGVFEEEEVARFAEAAKFLWAVRNHLHDLAGRAT
ncbi:MAG: hypothetical protein AAFR52_13490, partial [Pseudomonadota bacterium]